MVEGCAKNHTRQDTAGSLNVTLVRVGICTARIVRDMHCKKHLCCFQVQRPFLSMESAYLWNSTDFVQYPLSQAQDKRINGHFPISRTFALHMYALKNWKHLVVLAYSPYSCLCTSHVLSGMSWFPGGLIYGGRIHDAGW